MGKNRKIKKAIQSLQRRIDEHKQKIAEYQGKNEFVMKYWEKEIETYEKQKTEKEKRLKKG
jgi:hypothetical protein